MTLSSFLLPAMMAGSLLTIGEAHAGTSSDSPQRWDEALVSAAQQVTLGPRPLFLVNDMSTVNGHLF